MEALRGKCKNTFLKNDSIYKSDLKQVKDRMPRKHKIQNSNLNSAMN